MSTVTYIYIIGDSEIDLWGLSGRERLKRMIRASQNAQLVEHPDKIPTKSPALLIYANHLYDTRVIAALIGAQENMVLCNHNDYPVAIRTKGNEVAAILPDLLREGSKRTIADLPKKMVGELTLGTQRHLRKKDPPYLWPITRKNRITLESELFSGSYKGVTDLVTKWLWPFPAFWATHLCVHHGWRPNHVTYLSIILATLAGFAFWHGFFVIGLLMGWFMTFLDTVDGKLARVTVTSTKLGDVLDHGLDLIHPPLWYVAWAVGLATTLHPLGYVTFYIWLIFIGYIGGRLCEGAFQVWFASFSIFVWQQKDSFNRLITARRNPNLILLTYGCLIGRPDIGFYLVIIWHLVSTIYLGSRVVTAWRMYKRDGALSSWVEGVDFSQGRKTLAEKVFTRMPLDPKDYN